MKIHLFEIKTEQLIKMDSTCSICLEDLNDKPKTVACNHVFHATCIDEWLKNHSTCPVCRMQLREQAPPEVLNRFGFLQLFRQNLPNHHPFEFLQSLQELDESPNIFDYSPTQYDVFFDVIDNSSNGLSGLMYISPRLFNPYHTASV